MTPFFKFLIPLAIASSTAAHAGIIQVGGTAGGPNGQVSNKPGVCTVDFNSGTAANTCGANYTKLDGTALSSTTIRTGNSSTAVAPFGDTTFYLAVGPSNGTPIMITLATPANYFGFFGGSLDSFNIVQFYNDGILVDSFTGTDINAVAFPGTSASGANNAYVDYFPAALYNRIVYSSSADAFETDNHAFGLATPSVVPEPGSMALLGLGALTLALRRRRR